MRQHSKAIAALLVVTAVACGEVPIAPPPAPSNSMSGKQGTCVRLEAISISAGHIDIVEEGIVIIVNVRSPAGPDNYTVRLPTEGMVWRLEPNHRYQLPSQLCVSNDESTQVEVGVFALPTSATLEALRLIESEFVDLVTDLIPGKRIGGAILKRIAKYAVGRAGDEAIRSIENGRLVGYRKSAGSIIGATGQIADEDGGFVIFATLTETSHIQQTAPKASEWSEIESVRKTV